MGALSFQNPLRKSTAAEKWNGNQSWCFYITTESTEVKCCFSTAKHSSTRLNLLLFSFPLAKAVDNTWYFFCYHLGRGFLRGDWIQEGEVKHCRPLIGQRELSLAQHPAKTCQCHLQRFYSLDPDFKKWQPLYTTNKTADISLFSRIQQVLRWRWCHGSFMLRCYSNQLIIPPTLRGYYHPWVLSAPEYEN